jgi:hypothetical protein
MAQPRVEVVGDAALVEGCAVALLEVADSDVDEPGAEGRASFLGQLK